MYCSVIFVYKIKNEIFSNLLKVNLIQNYLKNFNSEYGEMIVQSNCKESSKNFKKIMGRL